jgi:hypothetical protein
VPHAAVARIISITPIAPFVAAAMRPPNAIAGATHAKNRKRVAAGTFALRPSFQSEA